MKENEHMKIIVLIVLCELLLFGCGSNNITEISEKDFQNNIQLEQKRVVTKPILNVYDFFIKDSLIVVRNNRKDSLFMVFDIKDFQCINSWGEKGNGPNEYLSPRIINSTDTNIYILDFQLKRMNTVNVLNHNICNNRMIENSDLPQMIKSTGESQFFYDRFDSKKQEIVKWDSLKSKKSIYKFDDLASEYKNTSVYNGFLGVNSKARRIVYAYQYLRRFDILDFNGNVIKKIQITPSSRPLLNKNKIDNIRSTTYYFGLRTTEKSFFLYYVGYTGKELSKDLNMDTYFEEYDWNGTPINRYRVNRFIWNFDLYYSNNCVNFIGLDQDNELPFILLN